MRNLVFSIVILLIVSCKTSEKQLIHPIVSDAVKGKNIGIVSHQYKEKGCDIIIIVNKGKDKPLHLIPINELEVKFNKDNLKISFDYLPLRVKNPEGCNEGIPAEITNIAIEGK
ncbi:MAG: hypothetical protein ACOYO1_06985 [Bacteroidales bacterium]